MMVAVSTSTGEGDQDVRRAVAEALGVDTEAAAALPRPLPDLATRQRQHTAPDTDVFRCRAEAVRWLLSWAIDAVVRAHDDRVAAENLAVLFAQSSSR